MAKLKRGLIKNSISKKTVSTNIRKLIRFEKMPQKQAVAISLGLQKKDKGRKK